ncbi:GNAT family N-acetyltransferase [Streptomyces sp. NPDC060085]|uniref:GNAT family N-acetyltransferase n=1 Tax=Streptomyces sp. NPDC060085 TaxID=3347054 RepID=UPI00365BC48B
MLYAGTGSTQPNRPGTFKLPGIGQGHQPGITRALQAAGFSAAASHNYYQHALVPSPSQPAFPLAELHQKTNPPGLQLALFEHDGLTVATATLHRYENDQWQLWDLSVRADRRRRGIASHLLAQCLHTALNHGAAGVFAYVSVDHHSGRRLLSKSGFTNVDTLTIYHRRP